MFVRRILVRTKRKAAVPLQDGLVDISTQQRHRHRISSCVLDADTSTVLLLLLLLPAKRLFTLEYSSSLLFHPSCLMRFTTITATVISQKP